MPEVEARMEGMAPLQEPRVAAPVARRWSRRLNLVTVDQAVSGGSNVLVTVLAARSLSAASFGLFGVLFLLTVLAVGVVRALVSEPVLVHPRDADEAPEEPMAAALWLTLAGSVVLGLGAAGGWWLPVELRLSLAVVAVCLPLVAAQDLGRYLAFARAEPQVALFSDALWLVLMLVAVLAIVVAGVASLTVFVAAWLGAGALASLSLVGRYGAGARPSLRWVRLRWDFSWRYLASFVANQGGTVASSIALGVIAGPAALGAVRGALLLYRPFSAFYIGAIATGVAEVARSAPFGAGLLRDALRRTGVPAVVALLNGAILLVLPGFLGRAVLGQTWSLAAQLLVPATVQTLLVGLTAGARVGLVGRRATRRTLALDLVTVPLTAVVSLSAAGLGGAAGFYWGLAVAQAVTLVLWWTSLTRLSRRGPMDV